MIKRRGLSSVVGTVFAIIALASTVGYITYSMNILDNYNQSILARNQQATDITKEKFQVNSVTMVNNKLNITVVNTGSLPVNFTKIWITNKTATTTAWVKSYTPTSSTVAPGNTLTNLGINGISTWLNTNYPYHVKIVTSRGNTNEFDVNSVSTNPVNIQLIASPASIASGFKSQLIMTVTNNQTGTLTNLVPSISLNPGNSTTCVADPAIIPASYNTLQPGGTAIFTYGVKVTGSIDGNTCTYKAQLTNGYAKNNVNATITMNTISLTSTTYAANSGVVSDSYTSFGWTQGGTWNNHWQFPSGTTTDFKIIISNNNATAGNYKLWISKNTQIYLLQTALPSNGKLVATPFFIVSAIPSNPATPPVITAYSDYSTGIANGGGQATIYFGANSAGGSTQQVTSNLLPGTYFGFVLVYGKFAVNSGDIGSSYAQAIPFLAVVLS